MEIKRSDIKFNVIKEIIIRLDYDKISEETIDEIKIELEPFLLKNGFTSKSSSDDSNYKISNGSNITISNSFICYTLINEKYLDFDNRMDFFENVFKIVNSKANLKLSRFGLRKINWCYLLELNKLFEYFKENLFNYNVFSDSSSGDAFSKKYLLKRNGYKAIVLDSIDNGMINDEIEAYKVSIDIDMILEYQNIDRLINEGFKNTIESLNNKLFELFMAHLTDKFIENISNKEFDIPEDLLGVDRNE